ncbi:hypothetical protein NW759_016741 [Fusarium solani]|nr:hypothetical protein NW759_016741 [Fusarium solani]
MEHRPESDRPLKRVKYQQHDDDTAPYPSLRQSILPQSRRRLSLTFSHVLIKLLNQLAYLICCPRRQLLLQSSPPIPKVPRAMSR